MSLLRPDLMKKCPISHTRKPIQGYEAKPAFTTKSIDTVFPTTQSNDFASISIRGVVLLVQAVQQIFTCDEAAHILRLFFVPSVDCTCHAVSRALHQNRTQSS